MVMVLIGAAFCCLGAYSVIWWLYENFRTPVFLLLGGLRQLVARERLPKKYGQWAVITGASDGIGKGYANYLASKGMSLVLVARNVAKLNRVAQELSSKYAVQTKVMVLDFSSTEHRVYDHLEEALAPLDIGILVNNVGVSYDRAMCLDELPKRLLWNLLNVNMASVTLLCHMLVPAMKRRGRGLIINVASMSAMAPAPFLTVYAATKAYVRHFSVALAEEVRPHRIQVQTVLPGFVRTNMTEALAVASNDRCVSRYFVDLGSYMRYAGFSIGKSDLTSGYWLHGLQSAGLTLVPEFVRIFILKWIHGHLRKKHAA